MCAFFYDWDWTLAEGEYRRAIELNAENVLAHVVYAEFLAARGRNDEAIREAQRAIELDPLSALAAFRLGFVFYFAGRNDEAIEMFKKGIELDPNFPGNYALLAIVCAGKGDLVEATRWAEDPFFVRTLFSSGPRGLIYALTGRRTDALQMLSELEQLSKKHYVSPHHSILTNYALGNMDACRAALQQAYEDRTNTLVFFNTIPALQALRSEPFLQEILRTMGLRE
jgi:tetratricopeptide (TPR) repeat protein